MTKVVLVVEDDDEVRDFLRDVLERGNYQVLTARNGKEAEARLNERTVDLLITDIFMPEKDGIETIKNALKQHPGLPIIAVSGGSPRVPMDFLVFAERMGAVATMTKPILPSVMIAKVAELIGA
jgi:DNA-binding NtrC family response regulator